MRAQVTTIVAAIALAGCTERSLAGTAPAASSSASPPKRDPASLAAPAKAVMDQALVALGRCRMGPDALALLEWNDFDRCDVPEAQVHDLEARVGELDRAAEGVDLVGPAATFVTKARLYRDFLALVLHTKDARGAAPLYQDLAISYRAWTHEPVPLDPPTLIRAWFGVPEDANDKPRDAAEIFDRYLRNAHGTAKEAYEAFVAARKVVQWRRGPNGAFIGGRVPEDAVLTAH